MTVGWACAFGVLMSTAGSAWMEQQFNPYGYPSQLRSRSQGSDSLEPPSTSTWIITPADALSPPSSHQQKSINVLPSYALTSNDAHDAPPPGVPPLPPFPTPYQASPAVAQPGNAIISQPNGPTEPLLSPPAGVVAGGAVSTVGLLPPYAMSKTLRAYACLIGFVGIPLFGYLLLYGEEDRNHVYQLTAGSGYMASVIVLPFASTLPAGVTVAGSIMSIVFAVAILQKSALRVKLMASLIAASVISGGVVYSFLAGSPSASFSPGHYGFGAATLSDLSSSPMLSIVCWISVAILSVLFYFGWRWVVSKEAVGSHQAQKPNTFQWTTFLGCVMCSYPLVAGISILLYICGLFSFSPLDIMGVYTFPTSLRWDHPATFAMLFLWFTIIALAYMYRIKSVVYDELTDAELVGDRLEEEWRLGSEGKNLEDMEIYTSSEEEAKESVRESP